MRAAVMDGVIVVNIIEVPSLDILPNLIAAEHSGSIGDMWDGEKFIPQKEQHHG